MPDGSPNIMERWASIIVDEVLKEIRTNCRIQISIAPGAITCYGVANGPAGPMPVFSVNTNVVSGHGASF